MLYCPETKKFCFGFCRVKCCLVSGWITRENSHLFICLRINKISNLAQPQSSMLSNTSHNILPIILRFSVLFCELLTLYINRKIDEKLTVIQTSTPLHNFIQVPCTPKCLLCKFVLFWRANRVSLKLPMNETFRIRNNVDICQLNV